MYETQKYTASIAVADYLRDYVDVDTFIKCCKECPNYDKVWSCPSYDFDVIEYWNQYTQLDLTAVKITFDDDLVNKVYSKEEQKKILDESLFKEKKKLSKFLYEEEAKNPDSISLSAGSCMLCTDGCSKPSGKPCRFPDKMRYSIESIGGNVGLTLSKLMHIELEWIEENHLPHYFVLVCGLLKK